MTDYTHFGKVSGETAVAVGAKGAEIPITDSSGNLIHAGTTIAASGAEINRAADVSGRIVTLTGDTTVSVAVHEGKICLLGEVGGDAAAAITLPAATGSGAVYKFIVSVVNTSGYTVQVTTTDIMQGQIITASTGDTPDLGQPWVTAADSDTITLDGTTTGGVSIGDWIECIDVLSAKWAVYGVTTTSGTEATPFSAAVS